MNWDILFGFVLGAIFMLCFIRLGVFWQKHPDVSVWDILRGR